MKLEEQLIDCLVKNGADLVGFAGAGRLAPGDPALKIFPETKSVIGIAFRILRGSHRGIEEGSTYYRLITVYHGS
jgi:hypothetical protein